MAEIPDPADPSAATGPVAGAPSDNTTLSGVLADLRDAGFAADFRPGPTEGLVRCPECGTENPPEQLTDLVERRLEGASDPADMVLVVAGRCPTCGTGGAIALGYGPDAGEADAAIVVRLP
jgi:hypothetical protein